MTRTSSLLAFDIGHVSSNTLWHARKNACFWSHTTGVHGVSIDLSGPPEAGALSEVIDGSLEDAGGGLGIAEVSLGDAAGDLGAPAVNLGDSFVPETKHLRCHKCSHRAENGFISHETLLGNSDKPHHDAAGEDAIHPVRPIRIQRQLLVLMLLVTSSSLHPSMCLGSHMMCA